MKVSRKNVSVTELQEYSIDERFLKLPLDRMLEKMGVTPIAPQYALFNAIQNPNYRYIVAILARRTGKTFGAAIIGAMKTLEPGTSVLVIAPDYSLAEICFGEIRAIYNKFNLERTRENLKDRICVLANESYIRIASGNQIDSAVGRSYDLIIYDEAALTDKGDEGFNIALLPTLDKLNAKALFISTPRGYNWLHEFYQRGYSDESKYKRWLSIHSTVLDNPRIPQLIIDDARGAVSAGEFEQEYMANFVSYEGMIFNSLDGENVSDLAWIYEEQAATGRFDVIAGLDIGFRDPTAMVVFYVDIDEGIWYLMEAWEMNEKTTDQYAARVKESYDRHGCDYIFIDSAAAQMKHDFMTLYDLPCVNSIKDKLPGIVYVQAQIDNNRFVIDAQLEDLYKKLINYQWKTMDVEKKADPRHDNNSHSPDAIRYAMYSYKDNVSAYNHSEYTAK